MKKYTCILFDLDGTLLDTSKGVLKSVKYTIDTLGLPPISEETMKTFIGPPIQNSFRSVYGLDDEMTQKAADTFRNVYKDKFLLEADHYEGMTELLVQLRAGGCKLAVATYKREDYTLRLLDALDISKYFDIIKGSDMEGKLTKADIVQYCIEGFNRNKDEVVLIGDSVNDEVGAKAQNIDFIAVTYGFGYKNPSDVKDCVYTASSVEELKNFILGQKGSEL